MFGGLRESFGVGAEIHESLAQEGQMFDWTQYWFIEVERRVEAYKCYKEIIKIEPENSEVNK